jgi:hypothetical protein
MNTWDRNRLLKRLLGVAVLNAAIVLVHFPYTGSREPSSNLLAGPLWLFTTRGVEDKWIGAVCVAVALGLVDAFAFSPSRWTAAFLVLGIGIWVGMALYLSMLAAV